MDTDGTTSSARAEPGVHLLRSDDRAAEVDAFTEVVRSQGGARVGLAGVLGDLDRVARTVRVPAPAAAYGFRWDREDMRSQRWWPQGITTSSDATTGTGPATAPHADLQGRSLVVTSAYSHVVDGISHGARLTFTDITDPDRIRYRHVLLVEPVLRRGQVGLRPVTVHAGGIVWHGEHVHVAGTKRGFSSFRLSDVLRLPTGDASRLGVRLGGRPAGRPGGRPGSPAAVDAFGHRYVLPVRFTYDARSAHGTAQMRYSFASVDRSRTPHRLVAGEYVHSGGPARLARYDIDPETSLLSAAEDGRCVPVDLDDGGVLGMQGAVVSGDRWFVTTSRGRYRLGSLWVGRPGHLVEHRHQLPVGPEDITAWPERDELWSLSEYPGARYVYAIPRSRFA